jgi:hypothetical protein
MEDEMGLADITHGKDEKFKPILLEDPEGNSFFGKPRHKW